MNAKTLHHLADAIAALQAAYDTEEGGPASAHILDAEQDVFRAFRAIADGQFAPDEDEPKSSVLPFVPQSS